MTPAQAREELTRRALAADRTRLWLASAAHVAVSWRRGSGGEVVAEGPTLEEIAELERHAGDVEPAVRDGALEVLREVARV